MLRCAAYERIVGESSIIIFKTRSNSNKVFEIETFIHSNALHLLLKQKISNKVKGTSVTQLFVIIYLWMKSLLSTFSLL